MLDKPNKEYKEYTHWKNMRARCNATSIQKDRKHYVGISVCERWDSFENFYNDMGPKPFSNASVDRIDNEKDYTPENCRWANDYQQARNTSRNVTYTYKKFTGTIPEIAEHVGVNKWVLYKGLQNNRTLEEIISFNKKIKTITYNGLSLTKAQWAKHLGIKLPTMYARFSKFGDNLERILNSNLNV